MSVALSGQDTIIINNRVISDLANGDVGSLSFPNEIATLRTGKNGNAIYALNESGKQADVELRVIKGSADDKFFNGLLNSMQNNFAGFILMTGEFIKKVGDGTGAITNEQYVMSGGIFSMQIDARSNVEGDEEQSVSVYRLKFSNSPRVLG